MKHRKKKKSSRFSDPVVIIAFLGIAAISVFLIFSYTQRHSDAVAIRPDLYDDLSQECSLSLCDCRCYVTEEMPEIAEGKICGNDCYGMLGIERCEMINDTCTPVYQE